ncbi:hypothetical protein [Pantoea cypripedii]|uniref:Uncharacterized protein n=1 Tax=Pantoea cypripedii TaxID=55209 RepID=A0A1X1EQA2_PANCY|nr:hypothetical protein [Pantoea cypripedii]ORM92181.1 hypothetical protein HA50_01945 [Pantoea cypripedii]
MNVRELKYAFPGSLTRSSLEEISEVVNAACAGNIVFRSHPLRVQFRAATGGLLQQQRLLDGSTGYWTEHPVELEQWYRTYWCPLHQAAVDADQSAWRQALVHLYVSETGDLNTHESIHGYYDASALLLSQYEEDDDEEDGHGVSRIDSLRHQRYLAKVWVGRELYRALRLYRFGEKEMVRQAFIKGSQSRSVARHYEALSSLHQFKRPGLLLSWAIENTCELSGSEAGTQYLQQWITRLLADPGCSSLAESGAADGEWFREHLVRAASLFTELWREMFLPPLSIPAERHDQAQAGAPPLPQTHLCASTPYKDRIPDDAHCGDFLLALRFSCEGDAPHHGPSERQDTKPADQPNQVQSSHRNEQEGKDD